MKKPITWGILGTGDIARQMADDLRHVPGATLHAVASRTPERARRFADTHHIPVCYSDYHAIARDPEIDVIYIATPHSRHCEDALMCMEQGKAVLCEKPMALNGSEVERMFEAATEQGCFLMEAMWTAFFPAMQALRQDIADGLIGAPRLVQADFSYKATAGPNSRLFDAALGGGALMDIGVYGVALADMIFGSTPTSIASSWTTAPTGVDESAAMILDYGPGERAVLSTSLTYDAPQDAMIAGDEGVVLIPHRFSQPDVYIREVDGQGETFRFDRQGFGYHLEAAAVTECVRAGKIECEIAPWDASRRIVQTLDAIRAQWGLRYPTEQ